MSSFPRRLTQLRMDRENAEARVREMEDQLAEFQDELRRETGNKTVQQEHTHPMTPTQKYREKLSHPTIGFLKNKLRINSSTIFTG